uniref:KCNQ potassium channel n=1 Tax=Strongyloides stercoralis TaxID=6248 RepID=A0AAF5CT79_STRER
MKKKNSKTVSSSQSEEEIKNKLLANDLSLINKKTPFSQQPTLQNILPSSKNLEKRVIFKDPNELSVESINTESNQIQGTKTNNSLFSFNFNSPTSGDNLEIRKMSLVGKPLVYKNYRTDQKFRRIQSKMQNFLERPRGWKAATYHLSVLVMVLLCLALSVFSTMPDFEEGATVILYYIEIIFVIWLAIEYLCRVWSAGCRSRYRGIGGRIRFATSAYCVIDIIVILASIVVLCMGATGQVFAASAIRGLRFFQILRMLRIDRRAGSWRLLSSVIWAHRQELLTTVYIGFLGLIFSSFLVYLCEKNTNEKYSTFADALWWGVITLSTVGYGDLTPITWPGKMIAAFCALLGISFFALPAGILGSGFALKVQQHQRQKHLIRRRVPAAKLIQCLWRHYAAAPQSRSLATWKVYLQTVQIPQIVIDSKTKAKREKDGKRSLSCRIHRQILKSLHRRFSDLPNDLVKPLSKDNTYFNVENNHHTINSVKPTSTVGGNTGQTSLINRIRQSTKKKAPLTTEAPDCSSNYLSTENTYISGNYPNTTIKSLLLPKASDSVSLMSASDVSEIESLGTLGFSLGSWKSKSKTSQTLRKQAEDIVLHHRLITNQSSFVGTDDTYKNHHSFLSKSLTTDDEGTHPDNVQRRSYSCEDADDSNIVTSSGLPNVFNDYNFIIAPIYNWAESLKEKQKAAESRDQNDVENNFFGQLSACTSQQRQSVEYLIDDEIPNLKPRTLEEFTPALKNAIRAIRRIQLLVARRKFKEALKPYDVKDVIEQYSAGHVELQARVKTVQQRLDYIVGKQINKEEFKVSMASRICKVERSVEKIDKKLDLLVEMFLDDRRTGISGSLFRDPSREEHSSRGRSPPHSAIARFSNINIKRDNVSGDGNVSGDEKSPSSRTVIHNPLKRLQTKEIGEANILPENTVSSIDLNNINNEEEPFLLS